MKIDKIINKYFYYVLVLCIIFQVVLPIVCVFYKNDSITPFLKAVRYFCYSFCLLKIIFEYKKVTLFEMLGFVLSIIIFLFSGDKSIVVIMILLVASKEIDFKRFFSLLFKCLIVIFILIIVLSLIKIVPDWTYTRGSNIRHSLGFIYPTDCFSLYLIIVLLYYYLVDKLKMMELFIIENINVFLYLYTDGRMSFLLINIIIIWLVITKNKKIASFLNTIISKKFLKTILCAFPIIMTVISFSLIYMYDNKNVIALRVNELFSDRILYSSRAVSNYDLTFFGQEVEWYGWGGYGYLISKDGFEYNFVDNSYVRILIDYGIVPTMIIIISYGLLIKKFIAKTDYKSVFVIIIVLFWSFMEPYIFSARNVFILFFVILLNSDSNINMRLFDFKSKRKVIRCVSNN